MSRTASGLLTAGILTLTCCVPSLSAQTTGPSNPNGHGGQMAAPAANPGGLNEQTLPQFLRDAGHNPQEKLMANGSRVWTFTVQKDGWTFVVEMNVIKDKNGRTQGFWLNSPLGNAMPNNVTVPQLQRILQENRVTAPCFFYLRNGNQLCMALELPGAQLTQDLFRGDLNVLFDQVRRTQSVWDLNQMPAVGQAAFPK